MDFAFSSSSESDDDEDRPVSLFRHTEFYWQFQNGSHDAYGEPWPEQLPYYNNHLNEKPQEQPHANHPMQMQNGCDNSSFADTSRPLNGSRLLDISAISHSEEFVLVKHGDKYVSMRVLSPTKVHDNSLAMNFSPMEPLATPQQRHGRHSAVKIESPETEQPQICPEIPLERIDFTAPPVDPRINSVDYCYIGEDEDDLPWTLPLPKTLWRELLRRIAQDKNQERKMSGKPKLSNSFMLSQQNKRIGMAQRPVDPRIRPRLEQTLFPEPPLKTPSTESHNQSVPNLKRSIFDDENGDWSSDSSSSLSFSSANESAASNKRTANNLFDDDDDDDDLSFSTFNKRRTAGNRKDLEENKRDTNNATKNLLLEKPPAMDKDDILNSLTDNDATSDGEEKCTPIVPDEKDTTVNGLKTRRVDIEKRIVRKKIERKRVEPRKTETKKTVEKKKIEPKSKQPLKKKRISAIGHTNKFNKTDLGIASTNSTKKTADNRILTKPDVNKIVPQSDHVATSVSSKHSDISTTSTGSIEQRLSEMISPVRKEAIISTNQIDENLTDILETKASEAPKQADTKIISDHNSSTQSEPSPPFETIAECDGTNVPNYDQMPDLTSDVIDDFVADSLHLEKSYDNQHSNADDAVAKPHPSTHQPKESIDSTPSTPIDETNTDPVPMEIELQPELNVLKSGPTNNNNNVVGESDIGTNAEIFGITENINLDEYTKDFDPTSLDSFVIDPISSKSTNKKIGMKKSNKKKRAKIYIADFTDYDQSVNIAANIPINNDFEMSDDDLENDVPCEMDELILPNSNTDRNAVDKLKSHCSLCQYEAAKGWKQLTKHYVRQHQNCEIPISRLAKDQEPFYLARNPFTPTITKVSTELLIKSPCLICNEVYNLCSAKWLLHFIAHTGEYEFRCKKCQQIISQDLHKKCNSMNNERIHMHSFIDNVLYGYVCVQCKYIQLSKENLRMHLDREHQQLNQNDGQIIEITLLKSSSELKLCLMDIDDKFDKNLIDAKHRVQGASSVSEQNEAFIESTIDMTDDFDDTPMIDLTLSDED